MVNISKCAGLGEQGFAGIFDSQPVFGSEQQYGEATPLASSPLQPSIEPQILPRAKRSAWPR